MKRRETKVRIKLLVVLFGRLVLQKWSSCAVLAQVGSQANVEVEENRQDMGGPSVLSGWNFPKWTYSVLLTFPLPDIHLSFNISHLR